MSDKEAWLKEAKRYAKHAYCYEAMVDDFEEYFDGTGSPYDAVDMVGDKYDLDRADENWGINQNVKFMKLWERSNAGGE